MQKTVRATKTGNVFILILSLVVAVVPAIAANIRIQTSVDRKEMSPNDALVFSVEIQSDGSVESEPPNMIDLRDFEVQNQWSNQGSQRQMTFGASGPEFTQTDVRTYNYSLKPKREGNLRIPAFPLTVDKTKYYTQAYAIRVDRKLEEGPPPQAPSPGGGHGLPGIPEEEDADDLFSQLLRQRGLNVPPGMGGGGGSPRGYRSQPFNEKEAFFIQVEVDKTEAYVGEQITASWYIYTRGILRDIDTLKYPSLHSFWKEDIEVATQLNFQTAMINGLPYKKALLASFALFPMREGKVEIDPYTAKCTVIPANDMFGMFGVGKAYTFTKSSQPVKVLVRALPTEGKPKDFAGAVGQFQFSARVEDANISVGQPFIIKLRFEGQGNAKLIELPPLNLPEGLELYETQKDSQFFKNGNSFKEFSVLVIPRKDGNFILPPVSASVFNPITRKYEQKVSSAIPIVVMPAKSGDRLATQRLADSPKEAKPVPPTLQTTFTAGRQMPIPDRWWPWIALIVSGLALGLKGYYEFRWRERRTSLLQKMRVRVQGVRKNVSTLGARGVAAQLTNVYYQVLGDVSGLGGAIHEIERVLDEGPPSIRRELGDEIKKRLEILQTVAFAPESLVKDWSDKDKLIDLCDQSETLLAKAIALSGSED